MGNQNLYFASRRDFFSGIAELSSVQRWSMIFISTLNTNHARKLRWHEQINTFDGSLLNQSVFYMKLILHEQFYFAICREQNSSILEIIYFLNSSFRPIRLSLIFTRNYILPQKIILFFLLSLHVLYKKLTFFPFPKIAQLYLRLGYQLILSYLIRIRRINQRPLDLINLSAKYSSDNALSINQLVHA